MVSFVCESCNDTLKKPKLDSHAQRCRWARFTCLDCNTTFDGTSYRAHTSCISEEQKYQKSVYKAPKGKGNNNNNNNNQQQQQQQQVPVSTPVSLPPLPTPSPDVSMTVEDSNSKKRGRAVPTAAEAAASVVAEEQQPKKKSKKDKGKKKEALLDVQVGGGDLSQDADEESQAIVGEAASKKSKKQKQKQREVVAVVAAEGSDSPAENEDVEENEDEEVEDIDNAEGSALDTATKVAIAFEAQRQAQQQDIIVQPDLELHGGPINHHPAATPSTSRLPPVVPIAPTISNLASTADAAVNFAVNAPTIHAYLAALLPDLLTTSRSLATLKTAVLEAAVAQGWSDEAEVEKAFLEGVWVGGNKPKKMLVLNFERATQVKNEKRRKQKIKAQ